jgi:MFS family permease
VIPDDSHVLIRKVIRRILPLCILCALLNYINRTNIGMAQSTMEKHISAGVFTFGLTLFYLPYCLLELPSNLILQRVGARRWIAWIMLAWGAVSTCFMFARSEGLFYTLRALLGAAQAGFFPGVILYLSYWIPHRHRARATALFVLAQAMAMMIGNTCSGLILYAADKYHFPGESWQWLFLLEGLPTIVMGFVVLYYLTDKPGGAHWLAADERQSLARIMTEDRAGKHGHGAAEFRAALVAPHTWLLAFLYSMLVWGYYPVQSFAQVILKPILAQAGAIVLPPAASLPAGSAPSVPTPDYIVSIYLGLLTAIPFAIAAVVMLLFARHSDQRNERKWHVALASFLMALGLAVAALAPSLATGAAMTTMTIAGLTLSAIGWYCSFAIFWAIPPQLLSGTAVAASVAIINSIANLVGNFVGPNTRSLIENAYGKGLVHQYSLLLAAGCALLGAVVAAALRLPKQGPPQLHAIPTAPASSARS